MHKKSILFSAMLSLNACSPLDRIGGPLTASNFPPPGPSNFEKGMLDGCKSAASAIGGGTVLGVVYNKVYLDVDQSVNDAIYSRAWTDGFHYCKYELDATLLT